MRDLVVELADRPTGQAQQEFVKLLPAATLFIKVIGAAGPVRHGQGLLAGPEQPLRIRNGRLPNGTEMVLAYVTPPANVGPGETIATMTGIELLRMISKGNGDGLMVAAGDSRQSWTALTSVAIASILTESRKP